MRRGETEFFRSPRYPLLLLAAAAFWGSGCAARQPMQGMVLRVDPAAQTMLVSHQAVEGVMPAMVMPFRVARVSDLAPLLPGARIEFELRNHEAHRVRVLDARHTADFEFPRAANELKPGDAVPPFELTDQFGRPFLSAVAMRGRVTVINFLYTRCPLPEVCPRLAASLASLQRRFAAEIPAALTLVSITLDPTYDTPERLARYAGSMKARRDGWFFLTGATAPVAERFGLTHWAEEGTIIHNSQTVVVDRQGQIAAVVEGSSFRLEQLVDLVRQTLATGKRPSDPSDAANPR